MKRALALLLLGACSDSALVGASGEVTVGPAALVLPDAVIGGASTAELVATNAGRAPVTLSLSVSEPFTVAPSVELPGGAEVRIPVRFAPAAEGVASATVEATTDGRAFSIEVSATGVAPVVCDDPPPCHVRGPDCEAIPAEDGTPCGGVCVEGGTCVDGTCLGEPLACDDGDACTADACDPVAGCTSLDVADRCRSDDPCMVPRCDPAVGCVAEPAPDDTRCGPFSCSRASLCRGGACVEVEPPALEPCGEPSPCRPEGVCIDDVCEQPAARPLVPAFRLRPRAGLQIRYDGVTDPDGVLFWAECGAAACDVVSATREGFVRWRSALAAGDGPAAGNLALVGDTLVSTFVAGRVDALAARDGAPRWSKRHDELALAAGVDEGLAFEETGAPVKGPGGDVVVVLASRDAAIVAALEPATGELAWASALPGLVTRALADEQGNLYLATLPAGAGPADPALLRSLGADGRQRWSRTSTLAGPLGVSGGVLLDADGRLRDAATGAASAALPVELPLLPPSPLLAAGTLHVIALPPPSCTTCERWIPELQRLDETGALLRRRPLSAPEAWERTEPVLTAAGTVLLSTSVSGAPHCERPAFLEELDQDLAGVFRCELPPGSVLTGPASLSRGRYVALDGCSGALLAFDLPERELAARGWVTAGGEPGRSGRPR